MNDVDVFLKNNQDATYQLFASKLIPNIDSNKVLGIRIPLLRSLAKELIKKHLDERYLNEDHYYLEEILLHRYIIENIKDYELMIRKLNKYIKLVDNWATCDGFSNKTILKHKEEFLISIKEWLNNDAIYYKRFAIGMLMRYYLDEDFKDEYLTLVGEIQSDDYYLNMMIAWYFATALAKQASSVLTYINSAPFNEFVWKQFIKKSKESYRVNRELVDEINKVYIKKTIKK